MAILVSKTSRKGFRSEHALNSVRMRCVDLGNFSNEEKSLLRGGGLTSLKSGPSPAVPPVEDGDEVQALYWH